jgi:hypothetical protein
MRWKLTFKAGPSEITIFHPKAWEAMDGAGNANIRSDWYDIVHPRVSPIFSRKEEDHTERRKVWNRALSTKCKFCTLNGALVDG